MAMLQSVMRSSMLMASMTEPPYSWAKPRPPLAPSNPMRYRATSLAVTPGASCPLTLMRRTFNGLMARLCVASTSRTWVVPMPMAMDPKAPWVAVWESPQTIVMPGWVMPSSGPTMWTIPWLPVGRSKKRMPFSAQFLRSSRIMASARESAKGSCWLSVGMM